LVADRDYDADWLRHALAERGIAACISSKTNRKVPIPHDTDLFRQRHKVENMFGRLKDWCRIHTRHARCAHTLASPPNCPTKRDHLRRHSRARKRNARVYAQIARANSL
jgi:transposase